MSKHRYTWRIKRERALEKIRETVRLASVTPELTTTEEKPKSSRTRKQGQRSAGKQR